MTRRTRLRRNDKLFRSRKISGASPPPPRSHTSRGNIAARSAMADAADHGRKTKRRKTEERSRRGVVVSLARIPEEVCKQAGVCDAILRRPCSRRNEVGGRAQRQTRRFIHNKRKTWPRIGEPGIRRAMAPSRQCSELVSRLFRRAARGSADSTRSFVILLLSLALPLSFSIGIFVRPPPRGEWAAFNEPFCSAGKSKV